jgi:hypothetical protein
MIIKENELIRLFSIKRDWWKWKRVEEADRGKTIGRSSFGTSPTSDNWKENKRHVKSSMEDLTVVKIPEMRE